jgi:hypothetical protein
VAHIRTIKPEFFLHPRLYEGEQRTGLPLRLSFVGLWCHVDRDGRFKWCPQSLGAQILPYDKIEFAPVMDALVAGGHIIKYQVGDKFYGYIPSWHEHQRIPVNETASRIPEPPVQQPCNSCATDGEQLGNSCMTVVPQEGKGKEGKGRGKEHPPKKGGAGGGASRSTTTKPIQTAESVNIAAVVDHLRKVTGRQFDDTSAIDQIQRAMREDHASVQDCCLVIDDLWRSWASKSDMQAHVDKTTPFRKQNFSRYLDAAKAGAPKAGNGLTGPITKTLDQVVLADAQAFDGTDQEKREWMAEHPREWHERLAKELGITDWSSQC